MATCTWRNRRRWIPEQFAHEKTIERGFRRSIDSPSPKKRNIHGKNMIGIIFQIGNHAHYNLRRILSTMALFSYDRISKDPREKVWQRQMASSPSKLVFAETYATERRLGGSGSETQHQRTIFYQTLQAILATKSTIMIQTLSNYTPPQSHGGTPLPPPINPLPHPTAPQTNTTASTHPQSPPHSPTQ